MPTRKTRIGANNNDVGPDSACGRKVAARDRQGAAGSGFGRKVSTLDEPMPRVGINWPSACGRSLRKRDAPTTLRQTPGTPPLPPGTNGHRDALWLGFCTGLGFSGSALVGREWLPRSSSGLAHRRKVHIMAGQRLIAKWDLVEYRRGRLACYHDCGHGRRCGASCEDSPSDTPGKQVARLLGHAATRVGEARPRSRAVAGDGVPG